MTRAAVIADLVRAQLKQLKMPGLGRALDSLTRQARDDKWSTEELLHEALAVELVSRQESVIRQRLAEARFPEHKSLDQFDYGAVEGVDAAVVADLARGDYLAKAGNVLFAGPIGTGKTHLAIALGIEATRQRRRVAFVRTADLVRQLVEARDARDLGQIGRAHV